MLSYPCDWTLLRLDLIRVELAWTGTDLNGNPFLHAIWKMPSPTSLSEVPDLCMGRDLGSRSLGRSVTVALVLASTDVNLRVARKWSSAVTRRPKSFMGQCGCGSSTSSYGWIFGRTSSWCILPGGPQPTFCCHTWPSTLQWLPAAAAMGSNQSTAYLACAWRREHLAHQWVLHLGLLPHQLHAANWVFFCRWGRDSWRYQTPPPGW